MIPEHYEVIKRLRASFWWFVGRRDLFERLLERHLSVGEGWALDAGCGPGANEALYPAFGRPVLSLDMERGSLSAIEPAHGRARAAGSVLSLPIRDGSIQAALLLDVLEHIDDEGAALREVRRVLAPRGLLLLSVPALPCLWSFHDEQAGHRRRYRLGSLVSLVEASGYEVLSALYFNCALAVPMWLIRKGVRLSGRGAQKMEVEFSPTLVNLPLKWLLLAENRIAETGFKFPWGSSAVVVATPRSGAGG